MIIEVDREGLGGDVVTIRENTRKITDEIVDQGIILFAPEFSSVTVKSKMSFDGKKISVAQAMYTINKQPTDRLFLALSNLLISSDIRTAGGFYDHAVKLAENHFLMDKRKYVPAIAQGLVRFPMVLFEVRDHRSGVRDHQSGV